MLKDNIKKYRDNKGLGVNELARRAGVTGPYISSLESGIKTNPSRSVLNRIAEALDVKIADLLEESDTVIWEDRNIPELLKNEGVELIAIAKEFADSGLTLDEIKTILSAVKATKNFSK